MLQFSRGIGDLSSGFLSIKMRVRDITDIMTSIAKDFVEIVLDIPNWRSIIKYFFRLSKVMKYQARRTGRMLRNHLV